MFDNIINSNGIGITLSGIFFIFLGLVAIALVISLFNRYFNHKTSKESKKEKSEQKAGKGSTADIGTIPDEELAAIVAAIEAYRRIHYTEMLHEITFKHGDSRTPWKTRNKFSNRNSR